SPRAAASSRGRARPARHAPGWARGAQARGTGTCRQPAIGMPARRRWESAREVGPFNSAFRTPHYALLLLNHRDLEPIRLRHGERPVTPWGFGRLTVERPSFRLDLRRHGNNVLGRRHPQTEAVAFLAIPPLREIVLAEHDVAAAGFHLDAAHRPPLFPTLADDEAQHIPIPRDALVQVLHRERGGHGAEPQRLGLLPLGAGRSAFLGGTPGLLFLRGHRRPSSLS